FTVFVLIVPGRPSVLHSFPTRRSSDLGWESGNDNVDNNDRSRDKFNNGGNNGQWNREHTYVQSLGTPVLGDTGPGADAHHMRARSEEHTSELQSRENLVCRLLLEKKKK